MVDGLVLTGILVLFKKSSLQALFCSLFTFLEGRRERICEEGPISTITINS